VQKDWSPESERDRERRSLPSTVGPSEDLERTGVGLSPSHDYVNSELEIPVERNIKDINIRDFLVQLRDKIFFGEGQVSFADVREILDRFMVMEMPIEDRELVYGMVLRQFKEQDHKLTEIAFRENGPLIGPDADARRESLNRELANITERYTLPVFQTYDYLKIGPEHGGKTLAE